jgi:hypothetical protein
MAYRSYGDGIRSRGINPVKNMIRKRRVKCLILDGVMVTVSCEERSGN